MSDILLRFIHISDTHYAPDDYNPPYSYLRYTPKHGTLALIEAVNALPLMPDFILHTGDVAYDPHEDIYAEIRDVMSTFKAPLVYVPGNHDHSATLQTVLMGREEIMYPLYYETEYNGVRFIFLDSNGPGMQVPAGLVIDEQLAWLRDRFAQDDSRPIVVVVHHPLLPVGDSEWYDVFMLTVNGEAVHEILRPAASRIRGVFFGHVHQNIEMLRDGILYSSTLSSWAQFHTLPDQDMETIGDDKADPGFAVVTITRSCTTIQRHRFRVD